MSHALADSLNRRDASGHPWQTFDEELVQRIAADHHLSADLIHSLETSSHTWMTEFFQGLAHSDNGTPTDMAIIRRVAETTRGLARAGHVILAGLGGVLITRDFPAAIHVRIIASFEWRMQHLAAAENLSDHDARARVKLLDNDRAAFFGRFWPGVPFDTELFHMTLNAGLMSEAQMADCIAAVVHEHTPAHK
jgi:cytidylate kinase